MSTTVGTVTTVISGNADPLVKAVDVALRAIRNYKATVSGKGMTSKIGVDIKANMAAAAKSMKSDTRVIVNGLKEIKKEADRAAAAIRAISTALRATARSTTINVRGAGGVGRGGGGGAHGSMASAGFVSTIGTLGMTSLVGHAIKLNSAWQETDNLMNLLFKERASDVKTFAGTFSREIGRSEQDIREYTTKLGSMFTGVITDLNKATLATTHLTRRAVDLASAFNLADVDAINAMVSAVQGLPMPGTRRFGVSARITDINEWMQSQEQTKGLKLNDLNAEGRARVRAAFLSEKTVKMAGDAEATMNSYANSIKRAQGAMADMAREAVTPLAQAIAVVADKIADLKSWWDGLDSDFRESLTYVAVTAVSFMSLAGALAAVGLAVSTLTTTGALTGIATGLAAAGSVAIPAAIAFFTATTAIGALQNVLDEFDFGDKDPISMFVDWIDDVLGAAAEKLSRYSIAIVTELELLNEAMNPEKRQRYVPGKGYVPVGEGERWDRSMERVRRQSARYAGASMEDDKAGLTDFLKDSFTRGSSALFGGVKDLFKGLFDEMGGDYGKIFTREFQKILEREGLFKKQMLDEVKELKGAKVGEKVAKNIAHEVKNTRKYSDILASNEHFIKEMYEAVGMVPSFPEGMAPEGVDFALEAARERVWKSTKAKPVTMMVEFEPVGSIDELVGRSFATMTARRRSERSSAGPMTPEEMAAEASAEKRYAIGSFAAQQGIAAYQQAAPNTSSVVTGAVQGGQSGGPWGAVIGALIALAQLTKSFQKHGAIVEKTTGAFVKMVDGPLQHLLEPLNWISKALEQIAVVFDWINRGLNAFAELLFGFLGNIGSGFGKVTDAIGRLFGFGSDSGIPAMAEAVVEIVRQRIEAVTEDTENKLRQEMANIPKIVRMGWETWKATADQVSLGSLGASAVGATTGLSPSEAYDLIRNGGETHVTVQNVNIDSVATAEQIKEVLAGLGSWEQYVGESRTGNSAVSSIPTIGRRIVR